MDHRGNETEAGYSDHTEIATPSSPSAGKLRFYAKSDDNFYQKTSAGVETKIGGTGGGSNFAAASIVQSKKFTVGNGGTVTLASPPTPGNMLLLFTETNQFELTSVSQTNVAWTLMSSCRGPDTGATIVHVSRGIVSGSPGSTLTLNFTGSNQQIGFIYELSGLTKNTISAATYHDSHGTNTNCPIIVSCPGVYQGGGSFFAYIGQNGGSAFTFIDMGLGIWTLDLAADNTTGGQWQGAWHFHAGNANPVGQSASACFLPNNSGGGDSVMMVVQAV